MGTSQEGQFTDNSTPTNPGIDDFLAQTGIDPSTVGDYQAKARIYTIADENGDAAAKIPVCYQTDYRFRGKSLAMLSRHEYFALVATKQKPKTISNAKESGPGRKNSGIFEFDKGHPLHATHVQHLRSKQKTIIFSGRQPPHPGPPPTQDTSSTVTRNGSSLFHAQQCAWRRKANKFAMYWLVALRPEPNVCSSDHTTHPSYTWEALCQWISQLETCDKLISKFRLNALTNAVYGMHSDRRARTMMSAFRMRNRTIWSDEEKQNAKEWFGQTNNQSRSSHNSEEDLLHSGLFATGDDPLPLNEENKCRKDVQCSIDLHNALDSLFPLPDAFTNGEHAGDTDGQQRPHNTVSKIPRLNFQLPHIVQHKSRSITGVGPDDIISEMNAAVDDGGTTSDDDAVDTDDDSSVNSNPQPQPDLSTIIDRRLAGFEFAREQLQVVNKVRSYLESLGPHFNRNPTAPEQLRLLVTGMPGTGKSFVIKRVCDLVNWLDSGHVATMAYNGIAAVNIDGATLCSLLSISRPEKGAKSIQKLSNTRIIPG